jgi:hypothetical protein
MFTLKIKDSNGGGEGGWGGGGREDACWKVQSPPEVGGEVRTGKVTTKLATQFTSENFLS